MADESPSEREDRLQRSEERLQKQHGRLMEQPSPKTGSGGRFGKAASGVFSFFGEHKLIVFMAIRVAVVLYVVVKSKSNTSTSTTGQAAQGSLGNAGYQDQGTA